MAAPSYVYQLLASETLARWGAASPLGSPVTITYSFASSMPSGLPYSNFTAFNAIEIAATRAALAYISSLTNITFVETGGTGQLQFGNANLTAFGSGVGGRATYSYNGTGIFEATVILSNTGQSSLVNSDFVPGSITPNDIGGHAWGTLLHEIGHALGFKHPFETNIAGDAASLMPSNLDNLSNTIMSYTPFQPSNVAIVNGTPSSYTYFYSNLSSSTYSLFDIAALQYLYGADTTSTGNKVFAFSPTTPTFQTIYDSGPNNTIDASALTGASTINLTPGSTSNLAIVQTLPFPVPVPTQYNGTAALTIAYGAVVANAIGGSGNDVITGNDLANKLSGMSGADILIGGNGSDTLDGGAGADLMRGGAHNDVYGVDNAGDIVDESVAGSSGIDTVNAAVTVNLADAVHFKGNIENVTLLGAANINATGNGLANVLTGNSGANTLDGGAGADTARGLAGNDLYGVREITDVADESVAGSSGIDRVNSLVNFSLVTVAGAALGKGAIEAVILLGAANAFIYGNGFANVFIGNSGSNVLAAGAGNDTMTGAGGNDFFLFNTALNATTNVDTITDMNEAGNDTIRLENAIFTALTTVGALAAAAFQISTTGALDASDRIIYNNVNGQLSYDSNGNGAGGSVLFAQLDPGLALTATDFVVV